LAEQAQGATIRMININATSVLNYLLSELGWKNFANQYLMVLTPSEGG